MCVFLISPVPIAEPLTSELIDTPVFYNLAPRPIKYRVSVPIPILKHPITHNPLHSLQFTENNPPYHATQDQINKVKADVLL